MKVSKELLVPFNIGNFRMWYFLKSRPTPGTSSCTHRLTHRGCWNSEVKSKSCSGSVVSIQPWCSGTGSPRAVSALFPQSHTKHKWHLAGTSWLPTCPSELALNPADTCEYGFQSHYCFPLRVKGRDSPSPTAAQPSPPHFHLADAALTPKLQLDPTVLSWTLCSSRAELEEPPGSKTNPRVLRTQCQPVPLVLPAGLEWKQGWLLERGQPASRAGSWNRASCCAPGVLFGFSDTASFHSTQTNGKTLPRSLMRGGLLRNSESLPTLTQCFNTGDFRAGFFGIGESTALRSHTAPCICIFSLPQWNTGEPRATTAAKTWLEVQFPKTWVKQ